MASLVSLAMCEHHNTVQPVWTKPEKRMKLPPGCQEKKNAGEIQSTKIKSQQDKEWVKGNRLKKWRWRAPQTIVKKQELKKKQEKGRKQIKGPEGHKEMGKKCQI